MKNLKYTLTTLAAFLLAFSMILSINQLSLLEVLKPLFYLVSSFLVGSTLYGLFRYVKYIINF